MKVVCIKSFKDKTSAENIKDQTLIKIGDVLECDDELANERIQKGFCEKVEEVVEPVETTEEVVEETTKKKKSKKK